MSQLDEVDYCDDFVKQDGDVHEHSFIYMHSTTTTAYTFTCKSYKWSAKSLGAGSTRLESSDEGFTWIDSLSLYRTPPPLYGHLWRCFIRHCR